MGDLYKVAWMALSICVAFLVLSSTVAYQDARRSAARNRVVAAELGALKDMVGVSEATRQTLHAAMAGLDPDDTSWLSVFNGQIRGVIEFVFVDIINSSAFTALVIATTLGAGGYLVHALRAK